MIPLVYRALVISAILEIFFQQLFSQTLCIPTIAIWSGYTVSSEWRLRDGIGIAAIFVAFSWALYPEIAQTLRMVLALAGLFLGYILSHRYTLRNEMEFVGSLLLASIWGFGMRWTLLAACGTLLCVAALVLAAARRTRQSRPAS